MQADQLMKDFKPLNPWGRPMPKAPALRPLFQVHVELRDGKTVPIGPKMEQRAVEQLVYVINREIVAGREKRWSNPHGVLAAL